MEDTNDKKYVTYEEVEKFTNDFTGKTQTVGLQTF